MRRFPARSSKEGRKTMLGRKPWPLRMLSFALEISNAFSSRTPSKCNSIVSTPSAAASWQAAASDAAGLASAGGGPSAAHNNPRHRGSGRRSFCVVARDGGRLYGRLGYRAARCPSRRRERQPQARVSRLPAASPVTRLPARRADLVPRNPAGCVCGAAGTSGEAVAADGPAWGAASATPTGLEGSTAGVAFCSACRSAVPSDPPPRRVAPRASADLPREPSWAGHLSTFSLSAAARRRRCSKKSNHRRSRAKTDANSRMIGTNQGKIRSIFAQLIVASQPHGAGQIETGQVQTIGHQQQLADQFVRLLITVRLFGQQLAEILATCSSRSGRTKRGSAGGSLLWLSSFCSSVPSGNGGRPVSMK